MRYKRATEYAAILAMFLLAPVFLTTPLSTVHGAGSYALAPVYPGYAQENDTIGLVLTVTGANRSIYVFRFYVQDPASTTYHSINETYDNSVNPQYSFNVIVVYPSTSFRGRNALVGQYQAWVDQFNPVMKIKVATTSFYYLLTDNSVYQRTQTVKIQGSGYNGSEPVTLTLRLSTSPTPFLTVHVNATLGGIVSSAWKIPRNSTIGYYVVTLTGSTTIKNPADIQAFFVGAATMTIASLTSSQSSYQRTETMSFSFQPVYPDGTNANTGTAIVTLTDPTGASVNITATYNAVSNAFVARYKTSATDNTGTWNATMATNSFDDGNGNAGSIGPLTSLPQLAVASLTIDANVTSYVAIGQQLKLNATITYPDGSRLQSGVVGAYLLYSGSPTVNDTVSIIFDSGLQRWVGSYALQSTDPGGLWTLFIKASDSSTPSNSGSASKAVTTQDHPPVASFNTSPTTALTGTPISFNGTAGYDPDGTVVTWSWNFGDGNSGLGATTMHTYNSAGTYTVTLTITDNSGSTGTTTSQVTITDRPPTASFTSTPSTAPSGTLITFNGGASSDPDGTIVSWSWTFGDGNTGSGSTATHSYNSPGNYTVTLTVTDNSGSTGSTTSQVVITDRPPVVTVTASPTNPASGQKVTLTITAADPDGTIATIRVDWGDGTVDSLNGTATSDSHTYSYSGSSPKSYTITVTAIDSYSQTSSPVTSSVSVQPTTSSNGNGNISLPLYYFGILAVIIAAMLAGGFMAFRRHRVTHARLKIDLEAVKSEAGRIENQDFFQSVKDQLKKEKTDE